MAKNYNKTAKKPRLKKDLGDVLASHHVTDRVNSRFINHLSSARKIGGDQLSSIYAIISWVANQQSFDEATVRCMAETRFGVSDVEDIPESSYNALVKFLIDLRIEKTLC